MKRYCKNIQYKEKHITEWILNDNLVICEKIEKELELKDDISFQSLINWIKDYKLLSNEIIESLNKIRERRNIVHLKVLISFKSWLNSFNNLADLIDKYLDILDCIKENFNIKWL